MDPTRFDDPVRSLNYPASRRRTLGVLLGSTLAGLGLGSRCREAQAPPAPRGQH